MIAVTYQWLWLGTHFIFVTARRTYSSIFNVFNGGHGYIQKYDVLLRYDHPITVSICFMTFIPANFNPVSLPFLQLLSLLHQNAVVNIASMKYG